MSEPNYCPFCGAHGSLKFVGECFVEDGECFVEDGGFDEDAYEAEGPASKFRCSECGQAFVEWDSGEELDDKGGD